MLRLALVGDYSPDVVAHRAIPLALERVRSDLRTSFTWEWMPTHAIDDHADALAGFAAVWLVPGSPYENTAGALAAVRWAREQKRPFLGTCGGFQHALLEIARARTGLVEAGHAETHPDAPTLVITALARSLVGQRGIVRFAAGSRLRDIYASDSAEEGYHCRYGLNREHAPALAAAGLRFTAHDETGEIRGAELPVAEHPFFIGTLFQPERAALTGVTPPLARAFVEAALLT